MPETLTTETPSQRLKAQEAQLENMTDATSYEGISSFKEAAEIDHADSIEQLTKSREKLTLSLRCLLDDAERATTPEAIIQLLGSYDLYEIGIIAKNAEGAIGEYERTTEFLGNPENAEWWNRPALCENLP
jgi:hypothetical protein